jgi:two-component system cell cycle response regulator DivK
VRLAVFKLESAMTKIVVIEDNPFNMKLAAFLLHGAGYEVLQAVDAEAGLALIRAEQPMLVLMDVQLPGMDGIKATRMLKADPALAHIKIIALTAHAMNGDGESMLQAGCDGYLAKPFHRQEFLALVAQTLAAP